MITSVNANLAQPRVSKDFLNVIAGHAFCVINKGSIFQSEEGGEELATLMKDDPQTINLERPASNASDYEYRQYFELDAKLFDLRGAYCSGFEFGVAVAAAIINNGLDFDAMKAAIEAELAEAKEYWPKDILKENALVAS